MICLKLNPYRYLCTLLSAACNLPPLCDPHNLQSAQSAICTICNMLSVQCTQSTAICTICRFYAHNLQAASQRQVQPGHFLVWLQILNLQPGHFLVGVTSNFPGVTSKFPGLALKFPGVTSSFKSFLLLKQFHAHITRQLERHRYNILGFLDIDISYF